MRNETEEEELIARMFCEALRFIEYLIKFRVLIRKSQAPFDEVLLYALTGKNQLSLVYRIFELVDFQFESVRRDDWHLMITSMHNF